MAMLLSEDLKKRPEDLTVVCEPDDTFLAKDIYKLLTYADDVDIVLWFKNL